MSSAEAPRRATWRDWLTDRDPASSAVVEAFVAGSHATGPLGDRDRQMVLFVAALSRQVRGSVVAHARDALSAGTTFDELRHAVLLTALSAGLPCGALGFSTLQELEEAPP